MLGVVGCSIPSCHTMCVNRSTLSKFLGSLRNKPFCPLDFVCPSLMHVTGQPRPVISSTTHTAHSEQRAFLFNAIVESACIKARPKRTKPEPASRQYKTTIHSCELKSGLVLHVGLHSLVSSLKPGALDQLQHEFQHLTLTFGQINIIYDALNQFSSLSLHHTHVRGYHHS
jgi:hypothetical protein